MAHPRATAHTTSSQLLESYTGNRQHHDDMRVLVDKRGHVARHRGQGRHAWASRDSKRCIY